jgi:hypothetical protein
MFLGPVYTTSESAQFWGSLNCLTNMYWGSFFEAGQPKRKTNLWPPSNAMVKIVYTHTPSWYCD